MLDRLAPVICTLLVLTLAACSEQPAVTHRSVAPQQETEVAAAVSSRSGNAAAGSPATQGDVDRLAGAILALGPGVDPQEAARAARIAYDYTHQLKLSYNMTDPPIVHNAKIKNGFRERGLCVHWAADTEARLNRENFRTLEIHRAISPPPTLFHVDHSTAIISRKGDSLYDGIVLDGWRKGGELFWAPTREDTRYNWLPRKVELANRERKREEMRERMLTD